jgi:hypothetical protein
MKKNYLKIFVALAFVFSLGACSNCVECGDCPEGVTMTDASGNDVSSLEVCEEDAASKEEFDQGIEIIEALGCDCK